SGEPRSPCVGGPADSGATPGRDAGCASGDPVPSRQRAPGRARGARAAGTALALVAPVFGRQADGEALAPLLPPAGQDGAAPHVFHARAKSVLVDAPPIARAIRRTHAFLS